MADLTPGAVQINLQFTFGGMADKMLIAKQANVTLVAMGSITNKIPASAFGLRKIVAVNSVVKVDGLALMGVPNYTGDYIQLMDPTAAVNIAVDFTGAFNIVVIGY